MATQTDCGMDDMRCPSDPATCISGDKICDGKFSHHHRNKLKAGKSSSCCLDLVCWVYERETLIIQAIRTVHKERMKFVQRNADYQKFELRPLLVREFMAEKRYQLIFIIIIIVKYGIRTVLNFTRGYCM